MRRFRKALLSISILGLLLLLSMVWKREAVAGSNLQEFSADASRFAEELAAFFAEGHGMSKEEKEAMKAFSRLWASPSISPEERSEVVALSNQMLRVSQRNRNYFILWRDILTYYLGDSIRSPQYPELLRVLRAGVERRGMMGAEQLRFLQNAWGFFREGLLNQTLAFSWFARTKERSVLYEPELCFQFADVRLVCRSTKDSLQLHATSGSYYPFRHQWQGRGGEVHWERSGLTPEQARALLGGYTIDMSKSQYQADTVQLVEPEYFDAPVAGRLEDRLVRGASEDEILYPSVTTFSNRLQLKNRIGGIQFSGGVQMQGNRLVALGTPDAPVLFDLKRNGKPFVHVTAERVAFRKKSIAADYAQVVIRMGADSLYHSGLRFEYDDQAKRMRMSPTDLMITKSPLYSSYHNLLIYFDEIQWLQNQDANKLIIGPRLGATQANARFVSSSYFNREEFDQMMASDDRHPIFELASLSRKLKSRTFQIVDYARYVHQSEVEAKRMLMGLAMEGYLLYDVGNQTVTLLPFLFDRVSARLGKLDYDAIQFSSSVDKDKANAVLDLDSATLDIFSVRSVNISDSQRVVVQPLGKYLRMGRNRSFSFSGDVQVGLFRFKGDSLYFNYDTYSFDLSNLVQVYLQYQTDKYDLEGQRERIDILSQLSDLKGQVYIDKPDNKSGLRRNPDYPIFESTQRSFVYYDKPSIHRGVYNRDNFYFEVLPFTFHNLNRFEKKDILFPGKMHASDIFAPFDDTLRLRPDRSLGFIHPTPPAGLPVYQGKGTFYNSIDLSNNGLKGDGELEYITSRTQSNEFYFFPDSTVAVSRSFEIAERNEGITFPQVKSSVHQIRWLPKKDVLYAYRGERPFGMYGGEASFAGDYMLQPIGLQGRGTVNMQKAQMDSRRFIFNDFHWGADSMSVRLYIPGSQEVDAFSSGLLAGHIDYHTHEGEFWRKDAPISGELDALRYHCYADLISWPMEQDLLRFRTSAQVPEAAKREYPLHAMLDRDTIPTGSFFYSTHPEEDSLYFVSPRATFYLADPRLEADSVRYVLVADAVAYPDSMHIDIEAKRRMLPLKQARLVAGVQNRYHTVYDADLQLSGRYRYFGNGKVDYMDEQDSTETIVLDSIYVTGNSSGDGVATQGVGYISKDAGFRLSPYFGYQGHVMLDAEERDLFFDGGATPLHACNMAADRLAFKGRINPDSIYIPVASPAKNIDSGLVTSGSTVAYDSVHLYPGLITPRFNPMDRPLSAPAGFMTFNHKSGRFIVADSGSFLNPDSVVRRVEFDPNQCRLFTLGSLTMPFDFGQVKTLATGTVNQDLSDSTVSLRLFLDLKFLFSSEALQKLQQRLAGDEALVDLDQQQNVFLQGLKARLARPKYITFTELLKQSAPVKIPLPELASTVTFTDLQMVWDQESRSLVSVGRLGIGYLGGQYVGKKVNGYIEMIRSHNGDVFNLYIEPKSGEFYLFSFTGVTLYANSSDQDYMKIINDLSRKKRSIGADGPMPKYIYMTGTDTENQNLQARYKQLKNREAGR